MSLLTLEPDYLKAIPQAEQPEAVRQITVIRHDLPPGPCEPEELIRDPPPFGLLVISGAVCRDTMLGDHSSAHLFGPGTIIRPREASATSLPWETSYSCVVESSVAVLDDGFPEYMRRWPGLAQIIQRQLSAELEASLCQCSLTGLSLVDDRILALFWHLADVWGTVRREGVAIGLPLTHRLIGRLVAAERATISLALSRLASRGLLTKTGTRTWLLAPDSQRQLTGPDQ